MEYEKVKDWYQGKNLPPVEIRPTTEEVFEFLFSEADRLRAENERLTRAVEELAEVLEDENVCVQVNKGQGPCNGHCAAHWQEWAMREEG